MGFSTHYLGRLDIIPPLNDAEVEWLCAFRETERGFHPDDPYAVPMHPRAEVFEHPECALPGGGWVITAKPRVGLSRCDWEPCLQGCCLVWREVEKSNSAVEELAYLIDHFLRPGAHAQRDGRDDFAAFTFDHVVSGVIVAERNDSRGLFLIVADNNALSTQVLVPGDFLERFGGRWDEDGST